MKFILVMAFLVFSLFAKVDVNHADVKELTSLKGVGVKTANNIINYRDAHGCFQTIKDLKKVKGIGQKTLEKNLQNIEISKCEK